MRFIHNKYTANTQSGYINDPSINLLLRHPAVVNILCKGKITTEENMLCRLLYYIYLVMHKIIIRLYTKYMIYT